MGGAIGRAGAVLHARHTYTHCMWIYTIRRAEAVPSPLVERETTVSVLCTQAAMLFLLSDLK